MGIGWDAKEGEGHTIPLLRPLLFKSLGIAGHAETKERAREAFGMIKGEKGAIDPNLKAAIFAICAAADGSSFSDFTTLHKTYSLQERVGHRDGGLSNLEI